MKPSVSRSRSRGMVMLLVLALLLVLTLVGASMLRVSASESMALQAGAMQSVATTNSQMGIQEGVARLRTGTIIASVLPTCVGDVTGCSFPPPAIDDTQVPPRYRVLIYRRSRSLLTQNGNGTPNVIVASTGCAGRNTAAFCGDGAAFSAITEIEVQLPQAGGTNSGTYGDD